MPWSSAVIGITSCKDEGIELDILILGFGGGKIDLAVWAWFCEETKGRVS